MISPIDDSSNSPNNENESKIPMQSSTSDSGDGGNGTKLKVHIKSWRAVAAWHWVANDDSCGICRMPFDACCSDCKLPGDDCPLVWGQCSHCFHIHCIMKWLNTQAQQQCPMCRQEWKFKE